MWEVPYEMETTQCLLSVVCNLCKQFGPRSGRQNVGPDLDPNCLTLIVFLKEFSGKKKYFEKFPRGQSWTTEVASSKEKS